MRLVFGKRPMMFYQAGDKFSPDRVRILYPDGRPEFFYLRRYLHLGGRFWSRPCWSPVWRTTQEKQFEYMTGYDIFCEFQPAEFLGYL